MRKLDVEKIKKSLLHAALWTEGLDGKHDVSDFLPSAVSKITHIIESFLKRADEKDIQVYIEHFPDGEDQLGHDIWLSINGHGAGFFDHELGGSENRLQEICTNMRDETGAGFYINQVFVNELGHVLIE